MNKNGIIKFNYADLEKITSLEDRSYKSSNKILYAGFIPCVIYGKNIKTESKQVSGREIANIATRTGGLDGLRSNCYEINGEKYLVRDIQFESITGVIVHIDFYKIPKNDEFTHKIRINLKEKDLFRDGSINIPNRLVQIKCTSVNQIPTGINVFLSKITDEKVISSKLLDGNFFRKPKTILSILKRSSRK